MNSPKTNKLAHLARQLTSEKFRGSYLSRNVKAFLATQMRALRGDLSQTQFGKRLGKPQSVISRIENQGTTSNIQTLVEIAQKLNLGLIVRFVDYPTYVKLNSSYTQADISPSAYDQKVMDAFVGRGAEKIDAVKSAPKAELEWRSVPANTNLQHVESRTATAAQ